MKKLCYFKKNLKKNKSILYQSNNKLKEQFY